MDSAFDPVGIACKVLIIDDSDADRLTYKRYLAKSGMLKCVILESDCGEDGLVICLHHEPDVILLDYLLPDIDGLEFLQALKSRTPLPPPIIMLTGQGNEQVAVDAMKNGVHDYLVKGKLEAKQLTLAIRRVLMQRALQRKLAYQRRQQQLMSDIALRINQSLDLPKILATAVKGVRQLLDCDRTLIYRFETDMSGAVLAESVLPEWTASLGAQIEDTCFQNNGADRYLSGHRTAIANIYESHLTPCHIQLLEQFQVKACIVAPVLLQKAKASSPKRLWGLLIAHHCQSVRDWQSDELELLDSLAVQLAIAIQQSELVSTLQKRAATLHATNHQLLKTTKLLKRRNRELDEFAYIASHDLRAPLRAIANLAQWLQEDLSSQIPPENRKQLDLMQSRVQRLEGFIEGLLQYSRAGRQSLEATPVNTQDLTNEILEVLAPPPSLRIVTPDAMPVIQTQKLLLQQVLTNLIGNAIKYHDRSDGQVRIAIEERGEWIEFSIADDGPGIAPEYHERIFGVFQTLNSRDAIESTGIGLSIVKKLVEQQGGEIKVSSALGKGSTFSFSWPKTSQ